MFRRYNRWQSRFDQPDPYDGSYDATDPQSFNRYAYVQGDPVNFVDPSGLKEELVSTCTLQDGNCVVTVTSGPSTIDFALFSFFFNGFFGGGGGGIGVGGDPGGGGGGGGGLGHEAGAHSAAGQLNHLRKIRQ
jgi:hypothetical protein